MADEAEQMDEQLEDDVDDNAPSGMSESMSAGAALISKAFSEGSDLDLEAIYDIPIEISVVLGRSTLTINELLRMGKGAVVGLERKVGEAVDIFVNNRLVARGEVVIVEEKIGVTLTEIIRADKGSD